ncbi:MAG: hypothetical protein R2911_00610 [Caldilineaceae bacterium]
MASAANPSVNVGRRPSGENLYGYLFLTPWLIALGLLERPGLASLYLSLTKYDRNPSTGFAKRQLIAEDVYR